MKLAIPLMVLCASATDAFAQAGDQEASQTGVVMIYPDNPEPRNCFPQRTHKITVQDEKIEFRTPLPAGYHVWFEEGLARVYINRKCGFINEKHRIVIPPTFDNARNFSEGLAVVIQNGKHGYINAKGKVVITPEYEWAYWFQHGLGSVKKNGKFGLIDREDKWVLKPTYDGAIDPTRDGFWAYRLDGISEYLDKAGKVIRITDKFGRAIRRTGDRSPSAESVVVPRRRLRSRRRRLF